MRHELRLFFIALQFLTRMPVPRWVGFEPAWLQACLRHFPLVGACIGAWSAAVFWLAGLLWPVTVAAVLSVVATAWLTGAFHEDGLADTADALGGAVSRERALEIMKDSRIGSYGAVALCLALLLKVTSLAGLGQSPEPGGMAWTAVAMVWSHAVSRAAPVWLVWRLPYAGDAAHAKAKPLATQVSARGLAVAAVWSLLASVAAALVGERFGAGAGIGPWVTVTGAAMACCATTLWCARGLRRRLGGFTGDTLGATQQLVELAGLLAWLACGALFAGSARG